MERDRYRDRRSPPPDRFAPFTQVDSYVPGGSRPARPRSRSPPAGYRRRSRTPPRLQSDTWAPTRRDPFPPRDSRPRSPPPADTYAPRKDYPPRDRSPPRRDFAPRGGGYDSRRPRSPPRARSPLPIPKRGRDFSPNGRSARSPPPLKKERLTSPPRDYGRPRSPPRRGYSPPRDRAGYRPRSRSPPPRREDPYTATSWRRRSPSPRSARGSNSGRNSLAPSRRSSPRPDARGPPAAPPYRSPLQPSSSHRRESPPRARSPYRDDGRPQTDVHPSNGDPYPEREAMTSTPSEYRDRAPPTGPSSGRYSSGPPSGPSSTPVPISAHNRAPAGTPSGPGSYARGGFRGRGGGLPTREHPSTMRGRGWGGPPSYGRGGVPRGGDPYPPRDPYAPPPRDADFSRRGGYEDTSARGGRAGFRGSSSSKTYPLTQRFNVGAALADLPKVKPEGEKLPPLPGMDGSKADRLEEEAARLRKLIDDKELEKRKGLREWEHLEREREVASVRTQVAEEGLRRISGEESGGVAF